MPLISFSGAFTQVRALKRNFNGYILRNEPKMNNNKTLEVFKVNLYELKEKFSKKYFVFIAPFELLQWDRFHIQNYYLPHKMQPPDIFLLGLQLDIFFVEHRHITGMKPSEPLPFHRLSMVDLNKL